MSVVEAHVARSIQERMQKVLTVEFGAGFVTCRKSMRDAGKVSVTFDILVPPTSTAGAPLASPEDLISARVKNLAPLFAHHGITPADMVLTIMVNG